MVIRFFICVSLVLCTICCFGQVDVDKMRAEYATAVQNKKLCEANLKLLEGAANSATEKGYLAAYEILWAKHMGNPFTKLGQFKKGKKLLEEMIMKYPDNIDLRFIRWSVQTHAPSFLSYSKDRLRDKEYLVHNLHKLPNPKGREVIYIYLKEANSYLKGEHVFSQAELNELAK